MSQPIVRSILPLPLDPLDLGLPLTPWDPEILSLDPWDPEGLPLTSWDPESQPLTPWDPRPWTL